MASLLMASPIDCVDRITCGHLPRTLAPWILVRARLLGLCPFCSLPARDDLVTPGGLFGPTHRSCFAEWDRRQEALEFEFSCGLHPDPLVEERDFDRDDLEVVRAA
jgi:hypothetical protein